MPSNRSRDTQLNHGQLMAMEEKGEPVQDTSLSNVTSSKMFFISVEDKRVKSSQDGIKKRSNSHMNPDVTHPTSWLETLIHLLKGNIGAGLFGMGDAFRNAGLVAAPIMTLFLGVICVHSQHLLINAAWELKRRSKNDYMPDFADAMEMSFKYGPEKLRKFSRGIRVVVNTFLCITQLGFCCVYFVFIGSNLKQVMDYYGVVLDIHIHMLFLLLPILVSCWVRNLKFLVPISLLANLLMTVGICVVLYYITQDLPSVQTRDYIADWHQIPLFFGTAIFAFEGIGLVLPIQHQMRNPRSFHSPCGVLNVGMFIVTSLLIMIGFLGYLKFGDGVAASLTLNLDEGDVMAQSIKMAISLGILFTYALQMYVPIDIIWPELQDKWGPFKHPVMCELLFRTLLVVLTFTLAEAIPQLGLFISLVGAVSSTTLALLFPAILDSVIGYDAGYGRWRWRLVKNCFIFTIGIFAFITGTYVSVDEIIKEYSH